MGENKMATLNIVEGTVEMEGQKLPLSITEIIRAEQILKGKPVSFSISAKKEKE